MEEPVTDLEQVRRDTMELLRTDDESHVVHLTEQFLLESKAASEAEAVGDHPKDAPEVAAGVRVFYGNRLQYGPPKGRLYFYTGTADHPNDPCGDRRRLYVQMTTGSTVDPFRKCSGSQWGYQIVVY
jgi:hypothetical protein